MGLSFAWLRLFYLYGPREDHRRLIPSVINALLAGRPVATTSGDHMRDYLHVHDAANAIRTIAMSRVTGAINVGSGSAVRIREIVRRLGDEIGRPELIGWGQLTSRAEEPPFICAGVERLSAELNWSPARNLEQGLKETITWWENTAQTQCSSHE